MCKYVLGWLGLVVNVDRCLLAVAGLRTMWTLAVGELHPYQHHPMIDTRFDGRAKRSIFLRFNARTFPFNDYALKWIWWNCNIHIQYSQVVLGECPLSAHCVVRVIFVKLLFYSSFLWQHKYYFVVTVTAIQSAVTETVLVDASL